MDADNGDDGRDKLAMGGMRRVGRTVIRMRLTE